MRRPWPGDDDIGKWFSSSCALRQLLRPHTSHETKHDASVASFDNVVTHPCHTVTQIYDTCSQESECEKWLWGFPLCTSLYDLAFAVSVWRSALIWVLASKRLMIRLAFTDRNKSMQLQSYPHRSGGASLKPEVFCVRSHVVASTCLLVNPYLYF